MSDCPTLKTASGWHVYFRGLDRGTIKLPFGELRSRGSYVICPPSVHENGRVYTWLLAPRGPLPSVPAALLKLASNGGNGRGQHQQPRTLIPHGEGRHDYLADVAIRMARGGITDEQLIVAMLEAAFRTACEPLPPPRPGEFMDLARWAAELARIAGGERDAVELGRELRRLGDRWWVKA